MVAERVVVEKPHPALPPDVDLARQWFRNAALLVLGFVIVATTLAHLDVRSAKKDHTATHDSHIAMPLLGSKERASRGSIN